MTAPVRSCRCADHGAVCVHIEYPLDDADRSGTSAPFFAAQPSAAGVGDGPAVGTPTAADGRATNADDPTQEGLTA